jgi:hypothetical protein
MSSRWKRFYYEANLPTQTTAPTIRTTNNSGTGTIYDGPVATSPRYLNDDLFGKDGTYSNYTSIYGRRFSRGSTSDATSRTTIVNDDRFTSAGGVTTAMRTACDEQFLFYELTVSNGGDDQIYPVSSPIKMIKNFPNLIDCGWTDVEQVGTQLNFNYSIENYYYNSIEPSSSYIRWWRSTNTNPGGTLLKEETITATTTGTPSSTSRSGTSSYTPTSSDLGYYIVAEIIAVSSYTRHNGYTDNYSLASFPTGGVITGPLEFSSIAVKDYYGNKGLDNRDRWPTGTLNQYTGTVSGWNSGTVLRIRYRIYNFDTGLYWKPSTGTQTTASAAWDSWNSDGSGNGYISNVSVSGGTATFYDYFSLDQTKFNGGGSGPTWWLEIELSALRNGTRIFYNSSNLIPETYYISKRIDPTVSVSPSTVGLDTNVTISGTFAGFPATPSTNAYPRQYRVDYGDGTDSGWLPVGEWTNGTLNPTYSLTKSYSTAGTYTIRTRSIPFGTEATTTVTVATTPTNTVAPTLTTDTGNFSAGSVITINPGTWTGTNSYGYQLLVSTSTPVPDGSSTKTLTGTNLNQYTITLNDANASSYYFRGIVTGYQNSNKTGLSASASTATSARSTINPSTTISVGTATSSGFTISGTASPASYTAITEIQIWNSSQTSQVATITTSLPTINTTTGAWSYVWTGGSASTTYYAKVKIRSTDSDQTTITTGFAGPIATSAALTTPTSLTATTTDSSKIRLEWSGGAGETYMLYYLGSSNSWPSQAYTGADFTSTSSPYDWTTMSRGTDYYFWVRARNGTSPNFTYSSNWYPAQTTGIKGRAPYYAPGTPTDFATTAIKATQVDLSWTAPTTSSTQDAASGYDIYYTTSTTAPNANTAATTTSTTTTKSITSLTSDTTYYFYIRATNADNKSGWTSALEVKTRLAIPSPLSHVKRYVYNSDLSNTLTRVTSSQKRQDWSYSARVWYDLTWGPSANSTEYQIYFDTSTASPPTDSSTEDYTSTTTSYSDYWDQYDRGTVVYYYWVRAVKRQSGTIVNTSEWSSSTGGVSTATVVSGLTITLVNNSTGATSSASPGNTALTYLWTGVSTTALHYSRISATIAGTASGTVRSPGAV